MGKHVCLHKTHAPSTRAADHHPRPAPPPPPPRRMDCCWLPSPNRHNRLPRPRPRPRPTPLNQSPASHMPAAAAAAPSPRCRLLLLLLRSMGRPTQASLLACKGSLIRASDPFYSIACPSLSLSRSFDRHTGRRIHTYIPCRCAPSVRGTSEWRQQHSSRSRSAHVRSRLCRSRRCRRCCRRRGGLQLLVLKAAGCNDGGGGSRGGSAARNDDGAAAAAPNDGDDEATRMAPAAGPAAAAAAAAAAAGGAGAVVFIICVCVFGGCGRVSVTVRAHVTESAKQAIKDRGGGRNLIDSVTFSSLAYRLKKLIGGAPPLHSHWPPGLAINLTETKHTRTIESLAIYTPESKKKMALIDSRQCQAGSIF